MTDKFKYLRSVSPLFRAFEDGLLFLKEVQKIGNGGSTKIRWLLIAKFGVFLLNRKTFPRAFQIRKTISYRNLNSLIVTNSNLTLVGHRIHYTITCKNHMRTAARIFYIRNSLFDHPSLPFTLEIDKKDRPAFESEVYQCPKSSLLVNRFRSCLMESGANVDEAAAKSVCETLAKVTDSMTIDVSLANNQYIREVCMAISYDRELLELRLMKVSMKYMSQHLSTALNYSISIKKLAMIGVDFDSGPIPGVRRLFKEMTSPSIQEFVFEHCRFASPDSSAFFDSFAGYSGEAKVLSFPRCEFCKESLDSLFQALFFQPCWHSLTALLLSDVSLNDELASYLSQLSCCEWMLEKQCLRTLSVTKCGLEIGSLLPHLHRLESGYISLDLSNNLFLEPIKDFRFQSLCSLDVSLCAFSDESLRSLFVALRDDLDHSFRLIAANLSEITSGFYESITDMVIPHLTALVWDRNPMEFPTFQSFCGFLTHQPNLTEISISECIVKCDEMFTAVLATVVTNKPIEVARMAGNGMGIAILPVVDQLIRNGHLRVLDISGNQCGDRIMDLVVSALPPTIKEFYFAGYSPSDANSIFRVCEGLITHTSLVHASWPAEDIKPTLKKLTPSARPAVLKVLKQLRLKFVDRFGYSNDMAVADTNEMMSKFATMVNTAPDFMLKVKRSEKEEKDKGSDSTKSSNLDTKFIEYDGGLEGMIKECGCQTDVDPLLTILRNIDAQTNITSLAAQIAVPPL